MHQITTHFSEKFTLTKCFNFGMQKWFQKIYFPTHINYLRKNLSQVTAWLSKSCECQLSQVTAWLSGSCECQLSQVTACLSESCECQLSQVTAWLSGSCECQLSLVTACLSGSCECQLIIYLWWAFGSQNTEHQAISISLRVPTVLRNIICLL